MLNTNTQSSKQMTVTHRSGLWLCLLAMALPAVAAASVSISLTPLTAALTTAQTKKFTAMVKGASKTAVTWALSPAVGSLSAAGIYTPPAVIAATQTLRVTATSVADPVKSASATVTLNPSVIISLTPPTATLTTGQTKQFNATVKGASNIGVAWTLSPTVGTISATGLYTAPAAISTPEFVMLTATSLADPTKSVRAPLGITPQVSISLTPLSVALSASQTQQFKVTVGGSSNDAVEWRLTPTVGTISATGLYTAPIAIAASQTLTLEAASVADPKKSASVKIKIVTNTDPKTAFDYYVDSVNGEDHNPGTLALPFQTLSRINSLALVAGQSVGFKRRSEWREQLNITASGLPGRPITFGAYGDGPKPVINGADLKTTWLPESISTRNFTSNPNANSLTSWWLFSEASGGRVDSSGMSANTLSAKNGPSATSGPSTPRSIPYAQLFAAVNQQQLSRADADLSPGFPGKFGVADTSVTFGCWVRVSAATGDHGFLFGKSDSWYLYIEGSAFKVMVWDADFAAHRVVRDGYLAYTPGQWVHVTGRWTKGGEVALFINGAKQLGSDPSATMTHNSNEPFEFGTHKWHGSLDGALAEPFVFSTALTDSQIMDIYSGGLAGADLTAYWTTSAADPRQGFFSGQRLSSALSKEALAPGSIYYDSKTTRAYIRTLSDTPPNTGAEISVRDQAILINGQSHLAIANLQIQRSRYYGIYITGGGTDITVSGVLATQNAGMGIFAYDPLLYFSNLTFKDSEVSWNGVQGVALAAWADSVVSDNLDVHDNCIDDSLEDYTAGIRYICVDSHLNGVTNSIVKNSRVYNNGHGTSSWRGVGIWFDTTGFGCRMNNNVVYGNRRAGLMLEAPGQIGAQTVDHNVSYMNGIGVLLSRQSWNSVIVNNTLYKNGINLCIQGTPGGGDPIKMVGNTIANNITAAADTQELQALYGAENNNTDGYNNVYRRNSFGVQYKGFVLWGAGRPIDRYEELASILGGPMDSLETDPLLVQPPKDMTLKAGSTAIGTGLPFVGITASPANIGAK